MKKFLTIIVIAGILIAAKRASACSEAACVGGGGEMQPNFTVKMSHDGTPLAGAVVDVVTQPRNEKLFSGVTGQDGRVSVTNLPAGEFWLNAEYLGVSAANQCFHVEKRPSHGAKKRVSFEWGDYALGMHDVAGRLIDSQPSKGGTPLWNVTHRVEVPIRGSAIKLTNALTGAVCSADSDDKGEFTFPTVPKGTYVLHVDGGTAQSGREYDASNFVIKIRAKAQNETLLLTNREPSGGSCGGMSVELRQATK